MRKLITHSYWMLTVSHVWGKDFWSNILGWQIQHLFLFLLFKTPRKLRACTHSFPYKQHWPWDSVWPIGLNLKSLGRVLVQIYFTKQRGLSAYFQPLLAVNTDVRVGTAALIFWLREKPRVLPCMEPLNQQLAIVYCRLLEPEDTLLLRFSVLCCRIKSHWTFSWISSLNSEMAIVRW